MASMNILEQLEEQPPAKKLRIDNPEEQRELENSNESNFPKSTAEDDEVSENSIMDLPNRLHSRPVPLELNCEIFKCLNLPIQGKFIWGLGRGIYAMFGQKLLIKTKRLRNPQGNHWFGTNRVNLVISENGLNISANAINTHEAHIVFAEKGFPISGKYSRVDNFPGTLIYYYEVSVISFHYGVWIGLLDGTIHDQTTIGRFRNLYAIPTDIDTGCYLAGEPHNFELPEEQFNRARKNMGISMGVALC